MRKSRITKHLIMEKAIELFAQKGIENVSMDEIAKSLGVTKPVIYYYFKNKDDVIKYAFEVKAAKMKELYETIKENEKIDEFIKDIIDKHIEFFVKNMSNVKCFFKIIDSNKKYIFKMISDVVMENRVYLTKRIEKIKKTDERIKSIDTAIVIDFISSLISYVIMEKKMEREINIKRIYKIIDIFIKGVLFIFIILFMNLKSYSIELNINNIVDIAFTKNISLENAYITEKIYTEKIKEYYGLAYPQINLSATYTKNIEKPLAFMGGRKVEVGMENSYSLSLNLNQVLWSGGKVDTGIKMAEIYAGISKENTRFLKNSIKKSVKQIFYSVLYARELVALQKEILNISKQHLQTTEERFKQGLSNDLNVLRQKVELSNNEPALIKAENLYQTGILNLKNLLGLEINEEVTVNGKFEYELKEYDFDSIYKTALLNRPDYKLALLNRDMAEKQLRIEKSNYYPTLSLFATKQFSGQSETSRFPPEETRGWSFMTGLRFDMNIFSGFSTASKIKQAQGNLNIADKNIEDLKRKIKIEIKQALFNIEEAKKRIESQKIAVENSKRVLEVTEERFKNGLASQLELNDATVAYNASKVNYINAVYDYIIGCINLDYVVGI